jgi:acyl-coenzyme A thioesterase PaaI-like protein
MAEHAHAHEPLESGEIPDDWLNDTTDYQQCFVCGERNPIGLKLRYWQEGERIVTEFTGGAEHQGFPGLVHGGLISTILDETMGRTPLHNRTWVMTGRLEVRYRRPVPTGERLRISAWLTRQRRDAFESRGEVRDADDALLAEAKGLFLRVPDQVVDQAAEAHPELGEYFRRGGSG